MKNSKNLINEDDRIEEYDDTIQVAEDDDPTDSFNK